jgi:UPF0716 protein FxsA
MGLLLVILLLALPVAELVVLVQVAGEVGVLETIALLVLVSMVGVWLAKRAGLGVLRRLRRAQAEGRPPSREVADGALILLAGFLLLLPGFISDAAGIALLLPPVRAGVRVLVARRFRQQGRLVVMGRRRTGTEVWDAESWEEEPPGTRSRRRPGEREIGGPT